MSCKSDVKHTLPEATIVPSTYRLRAQGRGLGSAFTGLAKVRHGSPLGSRSETRLGGKELEIVESFHGFFGPGLPFLSTVFPVTVDQQTGQADACKQSCLQRLSRTEATRLGGPETRRRAVPNSKVDPYQTTNGSTRCIVLVHHSSGEKHVAGRTIALALSGPNPSRRWADLMTTVQDAVKGRKAYATYVWTT